MSKQSLTGIITQLQSDKVKVRRDAITLIEEAFVMDDKLINALAGNTGEFMAVFNALMVAINLERATCLKKGSFEKATAVSLDRLEKAGLAMRSVVERSVMHMNKKLSRALLDHLTDTMLYRNRLLPSLAVNYVKSILAICSYNPHLEHIEQERWVSLVSFAFAVILGDNLKDTRGFAEDEHDPPSDSIMEVDQISEDIKEISSGKRRRRNSLPQNTLPSSSSNQINPESTYTASAEQIHFMELLVVLFRSPWAPFASPGISQKILNRLHRFFLMFTTFSMAHGLAIVAVDLVLSQVELNSRDAVTEFGLKVWSPLLRHWRNKALDVRQGLIVAMATLLPLITQPHISEVPKHHIRERVNELYSCLEEDRISGTEGLPLDSLRFCLRDTQIEKKPFEADTFRSGFNFDSRHAMSWTAMELHADCARILHLYSERFETPGKRRKVESPISNILFCIRTTTNSSKIRSYQLQVLLFVIDRHWDIIHQELQQEITSTLLDLLAHDDIHSQSWIFLCLATIVSSRGTMNKGAIDWDSVWSHSVRRTNALNVCRAACHCAHTLLANQKLPVHRVLSDIEAFSRDLVVQGPTFPYDSVCAFLSDCLRIARQDMRLHRIHLPDKVLSWLSENWNMAVLDTRGLKMPSHAVNDVLELLETTCGLTRLSQIPFRFSLPDCLVVHTTLERHRTAAMRTYIVHGTLPAFHPPQHPSSQPLTVGDALLDSTPLMAPNPREIKISTFLIRSLDAILGEWQNAKDAISSATPEKIRRSLDAVVVALYFQASLVLNGTQSNRRVLQAACRVASFVTPCLELMRWKPAERALILLGLEPLISDGETQYEGDPWDVMVGPVKGSGLKRGTLVKLSQDINDNNPSFPSTQRALQRVMWQSTDVQDAFGNVIAALRRSLEALATPLQSTTQADEDGWATAKQGTDSNLLGYENQLCIELCMLFIAVAPILQSGNLNATRDKELTDFLLNCDVGAFLALAPGFLQVVRRRQMHVSDSTAEKLMDRLEDLLSRSYAFSRSATATILAIQFLHSTTHIWMRPALSQPKLTKSIRLLNAWLSNMVLEGKLGSWRIRDRLVCCLDHYITVDPHESFWSSREETEDENAEIQPDHNSFPSWLLPKMADDVDARVRFRVAVANARLLCATGFVNGDPMAIYERIREALSVDLNQWEHMLTRFIHLGNAMIVSSSVRRGPYWHLLEVCLYSSNYTGPIEAVVSGVASRLGLPDLRSLFEIYASQLVESIVISKQDFSRLPPSLLGYPDRKQCARASFSLLAPMVLARGGDSPEEGEDSMRIFEEHCNKAQKSISEGFLECFADVAGTRIVHWIDLFNRDGAVLSTSLSEDLARQIHTFAMKANGGIKPSTLIHQSLDRIVYAILRTIGEKDLSQEGTIFQTLNKQSERVGATFTALTSYRKLEDFKMHDPNLPAFGIVTVLQSLSWLSGIAGEVDTSRVVYHVLHHLLAAIGRSLLVNEQMRLLVALSVWISINLTAFKDATLLRTLMRGAIILLSQSDLTHYAQGILAWAFHYYGTLASLEPTFPDLMGRIARIAHDYSQNANDHVLSALGHELLDWTEKKAWELSKGPIRPQILNALFLWPRQPSGNLASLAEEVNNSQPLSDILQNQYITSGKFRLIRRLRDLTERGIYSRDQFCAKDFWHLKSCIPPPEHIQDEDIDAFVDVLFKNAAQIIPLNDKHMSSKSVTLFHQRASGISREGDKPNAAHISSRRSIILSLFDLLSSDDILQINQAYTTLRLLFSLQIPDFADIESWPREYQDEISYLRRCPIVPIPAAGRSLKELHAMGLATSVDFSHWVCEISTLLSDVLASADGFYAQLSSLVHSDPSFAVQMLPVLVHDLLSSGHNYARETLSTYFTLLLREEGVSPRCRHSIVEVVLHLRYFTPPSIDRDPLGYDKWLDIDFRLLSRGAMSCGAYTTALLFLELAADYSKPSLEDDIITEQILYDIYSHIEEPDGFYAIKSNDIRGFLTRRFHHEGQWDKAFQFHGADFAAGHGSYGATDIYQSLHCNGFDKLAMAVVQSSNSETIGSTPHSSELGYQLAWRTEMWDLPEPGSDRPAGSALYATLRAIHRDRDYCGLDVLLRNALREEMSRLNMTGNEDMTGIRERAQALICLREIRKWRDENFRSKLTVKDLEFESWQDFIDISPEFDFNTLEMVIATRMSLLQSIKQREQREQIGDLESPFVLGLKYLEQRCLVRLSEAARFSENHQIALNATTFAQRLEKTSTFEVSQEFANVLWLQKEHKLAVEYLKALLAGSLQGSDDKTTTRKALILSRLGTWSAEACLQKPTDIREQFFARAVALIFGSESQEEYETIDPGLAVIFYQYALFAEEQYHAILRSSEASRLKLYVDRKEIELKQIKDSLTREQFGSQRYEQISHYHNKVEAVHAQDVAQYSVHTQSRATFLVHAIENYSRCLESSDEYDDSAIIRLCSLWFANFRESKLHWNFTRSLDRIPSRKFIFLSRQLSARLSKSETSNSENQKHLQGLIIRMCTDHPFQSLYQVWALQEGIVDNEIGQQRLSRAASGSLSNNGRAEAAAEIFTKCRLYPQSAKRVQAIELLCKAYLEWAKYPLRGEKGATKRSKQPVPSHLVLRKIKNLPVPVTTAYTPLDHTLRYDNIVAISRYSETFSLAGGQNLPKISECIGTDGRRYKQLFKGEGGDDLRQDAVMEQVFELVNIVLKRDRRTRKRQLGVRCYQVIPLAPQAGLLEFVDNTTPLQLWLAPAHKRYRTGDIDASAFVDALSKYREKRSGKLIGNSDDLRNTFLKLLENFKPVFRHFFTERHKHPMAWFATRLNYARSAATTSIVGHILGLGDRHVSNILIDNTTGELVHIDLGIAFDQGKLLPVPELVPFRLTGDIVDGLGTAGTEGVFRRCAEETLRVLRAESGVITTVLEVFRHDPLHSWTASTIKIQRVQGPSDVSHPTSTGTSGLGIDMASDTADESADRALTSVHRKLDKSLSVEYTVNELIVQATDPTNLSHIFVGWSPYY